MMEGKSAESWTFEDVEEWLNKLGFVDYSEMFTKVHRIDGRTLLMLSEQDLRQPPLQLTVLGDIKRLAHHIQELKSSQSGLPLFASSRDHSSLYAGDDHGSLRSRRVAKVGGARTVSSHQLSRSAAGHDSDEYEEMDSNWRNNSAHVSYQHGGRFNVSDIPQELWKTVLSFLYVFAVFMLTAFVMVLVHDRVPEMDKYPPLPDLFLDNMPYVPWAFDACEIVGLTLGVMWFVLLFFHKHRFVLMRRFFSLMGTIFLLRCVTMLITSLSVPGRHLQCSGKRYGDWYTCMERTFEIWRGMGMSLQGVRSCGDYMFSGHTSVITMLTFFITEYTPRKYYYVHVISWCLNLFGIFFLLAAHEHYSIDVFVAFYLSSRLFMYYHTLANNRALHAADAKRTRVWFPLFAFFESKCEGRVPNQFETPLRDPLLFLKSVLMWISPSLYSRGDNTSVSTNGNNDSIKLSTLPDETMNIPKSSK